MSTVALYYIGIIGGAMLSGHFLSSRNWAMAATALIPAAFLLIRIVGETS